MTPLPLSWEGFWLPSLINATVFAALAAAVGLLVRRSIRQASEAEWLRPLLTQMFGVQEQTSEFAATAATAATAAAAHAQAAEQQSRTAAEQVTSEQAERAIVYLAEQVGVLLGEVQAMGARTDDLFAALVDAQALLEQQRPHDDGAASVTGRHRLRPHPEQEQP